MPELLEESYEVLTSLEPDHDRNESEDRVHVSTIKSYVLSSITNYGETDWESGPARNLLEMGVIFEDAIAARRRDMEYHPGEIEHECEDGGLIVGTPDGLIDRGEEVPRIVEIKHTSRSAKHSADSSHMAWVEWRWQLASYLAMMTVAMQEPWTVGEFWTMHTAGDYGTSTRWPLFKISVMSWTTDELMQHLGVMEKNRKRAYHWAQAKKSGDLTEALSKSVEKERKVVSV